MPHPLRFLRRVGHDAADSIMPVMPGGRFTARFSRTRPLPAPLPARPARVPTRARPGLLLLLGNEGSFKTLYLLSPRAFDGVEGEDGKTATPAIPDLARRARGERREAGGRGRAGAKKEKLVIESGSHQRTQVIGARVCGLFFLDG